MCEWCKLRETKTTAQCVPKLEVPLDHQLNPVTFQHFVQDLHHLSLEALKQPGSECDENTFV